MQEMYAAFNAWKEKFKDNILDMGGKLKPGGKVVTTSGVTDGPFVEAKEIVGGYMIVSAESFERALEVARECPGVMMPGASIEIREIGEVPDRDRRAPEPDRPGATAAPGLVEHFFRHEYGRLVPLLTRKVGVRHLELVEDAVQGALLAALTAWTARGLPDDPGAWLYRVAYNHLIGDLRRKAGRLRILERAVDACAEAADHPPPPYFAGEVRGRHAAHALRLLRRRHSAGIAAGPGAEDAVRLQHRGDRAAALHHRSERPQAPGARARPAARGRRSTSRRRRSTR